MYLRYLVPTVGMRLVRLVSTVGMTYRARLVPTVGMRLVRLVPTVGMTWGTPRSYGRNEVGSPCSYGRNDLVSKWYLSTKMYDLLPVSWSRRGPQH